MSSLTKALIVIIIIGGSSLGFKLWLTTSDLHTVTIQLEETKRELLAVRIQLQEMKEKVLILSEQNDQLKGDNTATNSVLQDTYKEIYEQSTMFTTIEENMSNLSQRSTSDENDKNMVQEESSQTTKILDEPTKEQIKSTLDTLNNILSSSR